MARNQKKLLGQTNDINICLNCPLLRCMGGGDFGKLAKRRGAAKDESANLCPRDLAVYLRKTRQANRIAPGVLTKANGLALFRQVLTEL